MKSEKKMKDGGKKVERKKGGKKLGGLYVEEGFVPSTF
jgi:hypothetical protein